MSSDVNSSGSTSINGVYLLGTGTCRVNSRRAQNSGCLIYNDLTLLFDCGGQVPERLVAAGGLQKCRHLHIHLSHRHIDHISGLLQLLQCLTWSDDPRHIMVENVFIHATEEVARLTKSMLELLDPMEYDLTKGGKLPKRKIFFEAGPDDGDWKYNFSDIKIQSVHLPEFYNHGIKFTYNNTVYAFTGDALVIDQALFEFAHKVDVLVFDFGHLVNKPRSKGLHEIDLAPAIELLVKAQPKVAYATHCYLRHRSDEFLDESQREIEEGLLLQQLTDELASQGYTGSVRLGEELLKVS